MIQADALTRRYGTFLAVDRVDFRIGQGEIVGLLGHNGAGKTTIMKMLTGFLEPSSGSVTVDGIDVADDPKAVQRNLGYLPESLPLYPEMTVIDFLDFTAELRGVREGRPAAVKEAIAATELEEKAFDAVHTLSRGFRQRVGVAQAILHRPRFLILDEPTNGLDPGQTQHMRDLIKRLAKDATVILSTHIMQEVTAVCGRVMILRNGKLVLDDSLDALTRSEHLVLSTSATREKLAPVIAKVAGAGTPEVLSSRDGHSRYRISLSGDIERSTAAVANAVVSAGLDVFALAPEHRDLETVFREVSESREVAA